LFSKQQNSEKYLVVSSEHEVQVIMSSVVILSKGAEKNGNISLPYYLENLISMINIMKTFDILHAIWMSV
jgi:hypothetical protein